MKSAIFLSLTLLKEKGREKKERTLETKSLPNAYSWIGKGPLVWALKVVE